ncbi:hypothetical protein CRUP_017631 [Coryphaenoides rupestris]|nr:hypothetical protein CRUP_017631 [Coryphaenoides rupestris]
MSFSSWDEGEGHLVVIIQQGVDGLLKPHQPVALFFTMSSTLSRKSSLEAYTRFRMFSRKSFTTLAFTGVWNGYVWRRSREAQETTEDRVTMGSVRRRWIDFSSSCSSVMATGLEGPLKRSFSWFLFSLLSCSWILRRSFLISSRCCSSNSANLRLETHEDRTRIRQTTDTQGSIILKL